MRYLLTKELTCNNIPGKGISIRKFVSSKKQVKPLYKQVVSLNGDSLNLSCILLTILYILIIYIVIFHYLVRLKHKSISFLKSHELRLSALIRRKVFEMNYRYLRRIHHLKIVVHTVHT